MPQSPGNRGPAPCCTPTFPTPTTAGQAARQVSVQAKAAIKPPPNWPSATQRKWRFRSWPATPRSNPGPTPDSCARASRLALQTGKVAASSISRIFYDGRQPGVALGTLKLAETLVTAPTTCTPKNGTWPLGCIYGLAGCLVLNPQPRRQQRAPGHAAGPDLDEIALIRMRMRV